MHAHFMRLAGLLLALSAIIGLSACQKKTAAVAPPQAAPPPPKPIATLTATPSEVHRGQSIQLQWSTRNATGVAIDDVGTVAASGSKELTPADSTTYTLTATGPGGSVQSSARVTVTASQTLTAPKTQAQTNTGPTDSELFQRSIKDIYFNYDRYDIRPADAPTLQADENFLAAHPNYRITISGNCDERGSEEYNLALGSSRANSVRDQLIKLGVAANRIQTVSYGKEKPVCDDHNEQCWQQNRRAHFASDR